MTLLTKYKLAIAGILIMFLYLMGTEVLDRFEELYGLYGEMKSHEAALLAPDELAKKELELKARHELLSQMVVKEGAEYGHDENGVIEFVETSARKFGVKIESLTPVAAKSESALKGVSFKIKLKSEYHKVGLFVDALEHGPFPVRITRIDLSARASHHLQVTLEGSAYVLESRATTARRKDHGIAEQ